MNQTNAKELVLTKLEAQNLHAELFELLAQIAELVDARENLVADAVVTVGMDGGDF